MGRDENPVCGDEMTVWIRVEKEIITEASFHVRGCEPAVAAGSAVTELITGGTLAEAGATTADKVISLLGGLPPVKRHCGFLAARAVQRAVADYQSRRS
jgi:nitrogen fixation protein NifU and related proteins